MFKDLTQRDYLRSRCDTFIVHETVAVIKLVPNIRKPAS